MALHDGTIIEHGDAFMLTAIEPEDAMETKDIVLESAIVVGGHTTLVGGPASVMSDNSVISGTGAKFTFEPEAS